MYTCMHTCIHFPPCSAPGIDLTGMMGEKDRAMFRKAGIQWAVLTRMCGISHSSPETQSMYRRQLRSQASHAQLYRRQVSLLWVGGPCRGAASGCSHPRRGSCAWQLLHTLSAGPFGAEEGFAISLSLTLGRLWGHWGTRHGCPHVEMTHPLRASSTPYTPTQGCLHRPQLTG